MDPTLVVSAFLVLALIVLALVVRYYRDRVAKLLDELQDSSTARRRAAEAHARLQSQWAPALSTYPLDPRSFRWVGGAFDGVQVETDRLVLVAFTGEGRPPPDARVRDLVRAGKVEWVEVPLAASAPTSAGP